MKLVIRMAFVLLLIGSAWGAAPAAAQEDPQAADPRLVVFEIFTRQG